MSEIETQRNIENLQSKEQKETFDVAKELKDLSKDVGVRIDTIEDLSKLSSEVVSKNIDYSNLAISELPKNKENIEMYSRFQQESIIFLIDLLEMNISKENLLDTTKLQTILKEKENSFSKEQQDVSKMLIKLIGNKDSALSKHYFTSWETVVARVEDGKNFAHYLAQKPEATGASASLSTTTEDSETETQPEKIPSTWEKAQKWIEDNPTPVTIAKVAGSAFVLYKIFKWWKGRNKPAAAPKSSKIWTLLKWTGILGVSGIAIAAIMKYAPDYLKNLASEAADKKADELKEWGEEKVEEVVAYAKSLIPENPFSKPKVSADFSDDNKETIGKLKENTILADQPDAKEKLSTLQSIYLPNTEVDHLLKNAKEKNVDTKKLEDAYKNRNDAYKKMEDICNRAPFDEDAFDEASASVVSYNQMLREEFSDVYSNTYPAGVISVISKNLTQAMRVANKIEIALQYPDLTKYALKKPFSKFAVAMFDSSQRSLLKAKVEGLERITSPSAAEKAELSKTKEILKDRHLLRSKSLVDADAGRRTELEGKAPLTDIEKTELESLQNKKNLLDKEIELKEVETKLKANPDDAALIKDQRKLLEEVTETRSKVISDSHDALMAKKNPKIKDKVLHDLDRISFDIKKQRKMLKRWEAELYAEARAINELPVDQRAAAATELGDKMKKFAGIKEQVDTNMWKVFKRASEYSDKNVEKRLHKWVNEVGIRDKGKKIFTTGGKIKWYGASVLVGGVSTYMSNPNMSWGSIAKEVALRSAPVSGWLIDFKEAFTGENAFTDEKIDTLGRAASLGFGFASFASDAAKLAPPFGTAAGAGGTIGLGILKTGKALKNLKVFGNMGSTLKNIEKVKTGAEFMKIGRAGDVALGSAMFLTALSFAGITVGVKEAGEVVLTDNMKKYIGDVLTEDEPEAA